MTDVLAGRVLPLVVGGLVGLVIGLLFFAGLWLTVRRATSSPRPKRLLAVSFAARTMVAVAALVLVARAGQWPLLGASLGFLAARPIVSRAVLGREAETRP